jgi:23S rRNA (adenine2030-N6)-methyltransferase
MNYRHAYHAGNFADVLKHAVLARIIEYLKRKDKAFRVIDTHAGIGLYDLSSKEAQKTGEWKAGVGRLLAAPLDPKIESLLKPVLDSVHALNQSGGLDFYPGSPLIARSLMRKQDRLSAIELHPMDAAALAEHFAGDFQTRVMELDGWLALGAHLPPKEKRGLVLIDPPFEEEGEFGRLARRISKAYRRWPGGIYALWYPIKDYAAVEGFRAALKDAGIPKILDIAITVRAAGPEPRLDGCGVAVVNPPFTLEDEMRVLLPFLADLLADGRGGGFALDWLAGEELTA